MIGHDDPGLLLAEQRHRTRNAFQIVSGTLSRAAAAQRGPAAAALRHAEAQIQAFALLDGELAGASQDERDHRPCLAAYLARLCAHLEAACLMPHQVRLVLDLHEALPIQPTACRNLGLAVTELALNAVKHAYAGRCDAVLGIATDHRDGHVRVAVADNGCGISGPGGATSTGLRYVERLMRQLGGACSCNTGPGGTRFVLSVPA